MQPSKSQKALKILSILSIIGAVLTILVAIFMVFGGGLLSNADLTDTADVAADLAAEGLTQQEAGAMFSIAGALAIFDGIISIVMGILGLGAAKDNQKIMPVWWIALITLCLNVITAVMNLFKGTLFGSGSSAIWSCLFAALVLWLANNIKEEAGK